MKRLHTVILLAGIVSFGSIDALACLCNPVKPKERVKIMKREADVIFVGEAQSVEGDLRDTRVTVSIRKSWKGDNVESFVIHTSGGCRVHFVEGKSYLVYAKADSNKRLVTDVCFGTRAIEVAKDDLKHLGRPLFEKVGVGGVVQK